MVEKQSSKHLETLIDGCFVEIKGYPDVSYEGKKVVYGYILGKIDTDEK